MADESEIASVFVGGFDFGTSEQDVKNHCGACGTVVSVDMRKGSAIVTYTSPAEAQNAVKVLEKSTIPGNTRYLDVHIDKKSLPEKPEYAEIASVFVGGFDFETTEEELKAHMGSAGTVIEVEMRKGSAVVTYSSPAEAEVAAKTLEKSTIPGNKRFIDVHKDRKCLPERPGMKRKFNEETGEGGSAKVLVRGFDFDTTKEQLMAHMSSVGTVTDTFWVDKGSANVVYSTTAEATAAIKTLNQTTIEGNTRFIDVIPGGDRAMKKVRGGKGGGGKGGDFGGGGGYAMMWPMMSGMGFGGGWGKGGFGGGGFGGWGGSWGGKGRKW